MELINTTCADAVLDMTAVDGFEGQKAARVVAKLTFDVRPDGSLSIVADDPVPVLRDDVETPTGILPRDTDLPDFEGVELIVNGAAYAPGGRPVTEMEVTLTLGSTVHRALVSGDRTWIGEGPSARPSAPAPFVRMPLTYDRAFGGTAEVWLDEHSVVPIRSPINPHGLGFDPEPIARALCRELGSPPTFPRFERTRRLPNVEHPSRRVSSWTDAPLPLSWSARPGSVCMSAPDQASPRAARLAPEPALRCDAELLSPAPGGGCPVELFGMTPRTSFAFRFPGCGVALDYTIDGRTGSVGLPLRRVVLAPEEARFYTVYEVKLRFATEVNGERSFRLRLIDG